MHGLHIANGVVQFRDDLDAPHRPDEVQLEPILAGVCRTDLELAAGYMNFTGVPGHEFVARVVVGSARFAPGTRVVGEINCGCGHCSLCASGDARHCADRTVLGILGRDGAFAERLTLPDINLHAVPDGVSDQEAVFTEPMAAACRILEQELLPEPETRVAILGDGKLGVLTAFVLAEAGHQVTLFGHHAAARATLFRGTGVSVHDASQLTGRFPVLVECTGRPEGFATALKHLAPRGHLVLKTTTAEAPVFHAAQLVIDEITVSGSRCGPFAPALKLLERHVLPVEKLVAASYPLVRGPEAFTHAATRVTLKVLLEPYS